MSRLTQGNHQQPEERQPTQQAAAVHVGISGATLSDILNHDHLPRLDILFRIAETFDTPREDVLRLAARMPLNDDEEPEPDDARGYSGLVEELLDEFRQVPDVWKEEAIRQVAMFRRLAELPTVRFVGDEDKKGEQPQPAPQEKNDESP